MADTGELQPGMLVGGCRIVKLIGRGGMGEVYLAEHQVLRKSVAIKTVRTNLPDPQLAGERFLKEARLAARVEHPNVITIHDAGEMNGLLYIVMQFVNGQDLSQVLKAATAPLDWRLVMTWMRDAAAGLEEVHAQGLIHRDIKPHNLMLTSSGRILVMDFGLVREDAPDASVTSGIIGSPAYMSPEQCRSERLDHRTDIYSLGATAYNLLSGSPPFLEKSVHLIIMKLAQNAVAARLDRVRPDIPAEVANVVARAMAPDREQRIADARTLAAEIDRLLVELPAGAGMPVETAIGRGFASSAAGSSPRIISELPAISPSPVETADSSVHETFQTEVPPANAPRRALPSGKHLAVALMIGFVAVALASWMLFGKAEPVPKAVAQTLPEKAKESTPPKPDPEAKPETPSSKKAEESAVPVEITSKRPEAATDVDSPTLPKPESEAKPETSIAAGAHAGEAWDKNGLAIPFRWCPPGTFTMGTPGATDDESPVSVTLTHGVWIGETEVTQWQWQAVMETTPWKGEIAVIVGTDFPAVNVSHDDAVAFCQKYTDRERAAGRLPSGWSYRLPTEAEWEYACRAGTSTKYSFGNDDDKLGEYAWFVKNTLYVGEQYAHRVGQKAANAWGLKDMHGNVWEWCAGQYVGLGGPVPVIRGGGWNEGAEGCRSTFRYGDIPSARSYTGGFRLALSSSGN